MQAETPPTETRTRLYREPEDKKIAGVCGGLADHYGLDPRLVRIAAIVLALTNGIGVIAYVIAVVVIPQRPADVPRRSAPAERLPPNTSNALVIALVVMAVLIVGDGDVWWFEGPTVGFLLVGVGIWLLVSEREKSSVLTTPSVGRTTLTGEAASQSDSSGGDDHRTTLPSSEPDDSAGPRGEVPPPVPPWGSPNFPASDTTAVLPGAALPSVPSAAPSPRSPLLPAAVAGLLLVGAGLVALLQVFDVVHLNAAEQVGAILVLLGVGLSVGAWRGRARLLLAIGLPVLGCLLVAESVNLPLSAGAGERLIEVDSLTDLRALDTEQELLAGRLTIDLSDAPLAAADLRRLDLSADVGFGELQVILPEDVTAVVDAEVGIGELSWEAHEEGGVKVDRELVLTGREGAGRIHLDLHVGIGELDVRRG